MTDPDDLDLSDAERAALHDLQLGIEHLYRGYGSLLEFHHEIGRGMDRLADAEEKLRDAGHEGYADAIRDDHLPDGAVEDRWTFELVSSFRSGFLADVDAFESTVRDDLAEGLDHVTERRQQEEWRSRGDE